MILNRLRVDPVRQHPPFVVIALSPSLFWVYVRIVPFTILNPQYVASSSTPFNAASYWSHVSLFCRLGTPFDDSLALPFFPSPCNNIYCRGRSYGFLRTPAWTPACDCSICLMQTSSFASLPTLRDAPAGPLLRAFCMRAPDIDEIVQTIVIKSQHSQLGQLIHVDAHLERPVDRHFLLSKLYLEHVTISSKSSNHTDRFALSTTRWFCLSFFLPRLAFRRRCFPTTWTAMRGLCLGLRLFFAYSRSLCSQARWRFSLTCSRWFDALLWS